MKKINNYLSVLIFASLSIIGCQTETDDVEAVNDIAESRSIEKEYARLLYSIKPEGSILIQSNANLANQENNSNVGFSQNLGRGKDKSTTRVEFLNLDGDIANKSSASNTDFRNAFGKTLEYRIVDSENPTKSAETQTVYIPELLNVSYSTKVIEEGTVISWNIDLQNEKGLVVYANYNPISQPDVRIAYENPQLIREAIFLTEEMGEYVVQASDLERFPKNALLSVDVMRAGSVVESNEPVVAGLTKVNTDKQIIR